MKNFKKMIAGRHLQVSEWTYDYEKGLIRAHIEQKITNSK